MTGKRGSVLDDLVVINGQKTGHAGRGGSELGCRCLRNPKRRCRGALDD